jgi:hypothetical protein
LEIWYILVSPGMNRFSITSTFGRQCRSREDCFSPWFRVAPRSEEIATLAYSYWEQRGWQHGNDVEDWLRAEKELTSRYHQGY